ncbi:NAD+ binding protein [Aureococcus anophagefferens]|nr:NAD+ binding protein [Aureococcus anophagefferens]
MLNEAVDEATPEKPAEDAAPAAEEPASDAPSEATPETPESAPAAEDVPSITGAPARAMETDRARPKRTPPPVGEGTASDGKGSMKKVLFLSGGKGKDGDKAGGSAQWLAGMSKRASAVGESMSKLMAKSDKASPDKSFEEGGDARAAAATTRGEEGVRGELHDRGRAQGLRRRGHAHQRPHGLHQARGEARGADGGGGGGARADAPEQTSRLAALKIAMSHLSKRAPTPEDQIAALRTSTAWRTRPLFRWRGPKPSAEPEPAEFKARPRAMSTDEPSFALPEPSPFDAAAPPPPSPPRYDGERAAPRRARAAGGDARVRGQRRRRDARVHGRGQRREQRRRGKPGSSSSSRRLEAMRAAGLLPPHLLDPPPRPPLLESFDAAGVARYAAPRRDAAAERAAPPGGVVVEPFGDGDAGRDVVVLGGAGMSTSAGIPDFRSPGGAHDNLQKYDLPHPQAIFSIDYFRERPGAFYELCRELWPGTYAPTATHLFIKLLHDKGRLLRCFTQNIDSLETAAGLPPDRVVAAHGNFDGATCIDTGAPVAVSEVKAAVDAGPPGWAALRDRHGGLVKPDIVFFGEGLPRRFFELANRDLPRCRLLLVIGTSLSVQPFASWWGTSTTTASASW